VSYAVPKIVLTMSFALGLAVIPAASIAAGEKAVDQSPAQSPHSKIFKDWVVGCDNLRGCTALGLSPDEDEHYAAYVKITRAGAANDEPRVDFTLDADGATPASMLKLSLDGVAMSTQPLPITKQEDFAIASLSGDGARDFIDALRNAKILTLEAMEGVKAAASGNVSLAGSAAALLFIDAQQGRNDTTTALIAKGERPASIVPALPRAPLIAAKQMREMGDPPPPPPADIGSPSADCSNMTDPARVIAFELSSSQTLWGVCMDFGAYNYAYRFTVVDHGKARIASFETPGEKPATRSQLVNPDLSEDGMSLFALSKGRGLGDCGEQWSWAFDGETFRLLEYRASPICRGVPYDDWPVLYRAETK
jgi:hypothetical protein